MDENINRINAYCSHFSISSIIDYEYLQIIRKLAQYGLKPSGDKNRDRERLHRVELQKAQQENCVSSKFLTVTNGEQEKIQEKKKEKRVENNPELYKDTAKGQKILGEQILLAIWMKSEKEKKIEEAKRRKKD